MLPTLLYYSYFETNTWTIVCTNNKVAKAKFHRYIGNWCIAALICMMMVYSIVGNFASCTNGQRIANIIILRFRVFMLATPLFGARWLAIRPRLLTVECRQFIRAGESGNGNMYSQDGGHIIKHPLLQCKPRSYHWPPSQHPPPPHFSLVTF